MNFFIKLANSDMEDLINGVKKNNEKDIEEYLKRVNPQVGKTVNKYRGSGVDKGILELKAENLALDAARNYKPNQRSSFDTYLYANMKNMYREVNKMQNVARLPENVKRDYSHRTRDKNIYNIQESFHTGTGNDMMSNTSGESIENISKNSIQKSLGDLSPKEREVVEYLYGLNGRQKIEDSSKLQKRLGVSGARLSTMKKNISNKIGPSLARDLHRRG